jgi:serine/threonine-protein kinase
MDAQRWQRVNDLFQAALERPSEERMRFLAEACGDDQKLYDEVASLVNSHDLSTSFLEVPAIAADPEAVAPPEPRSLTGTVIGPYRIGAKLGQGGMGVVYLAEDARLGRRVALKALAPGFTGDEQRRKRLQQEARAAASLSHPGIATIYALEELNGDLFIVSEYVPGRTLRQELAAGGIAPRLLVTIALDIARALAAAHEQGVVHRDLKPENVIRGEDGSVKILDFGLARVQTPAGEPSITHLTEAGTILGTPAYMSPEQLRGRPVDFRTDLFSFGILLYEAATGTHPFAGSDTASTIVRVLEWNPPDLASLNPLVPLEFERIVRCCLQKDPESRYLRTKDLADDLDALRVSLAEGVPAAPVRRSGDTLDRLEKGTPRWWWRFHQVASAAIYYAMLYPLWLVREWSSRPYGSLIFFSALLAVGVAANLRIHLWFTSRVYPEELKGQRSMLSSWIQAADYLFTSVLVLAGVMVFNTHGATATVLLLVAVAAFLASAVVEKATARAAFGN